MMNEIKNFYDLSWQVDEPTYRADSALSYSTIARFHREGFNGLNKLFDKIESPSLLFGSLVDCLLTDSQEAFEELFIVAEFPNIPDSQSNIVKQLFDYYSEDYPTIEEIPNNIVSNTAEVLEFQKNWKPETRVKVIKENGSEYYKLLHLSIDKTLISTKDYKDAQECADILRTHPHTSHLFAPNNIFDKTIERFYQLKFKGIWNNINLRCMADLIMVDHDKKIVYPYDLKTSFKKEWDFHQSFLQWGYWIQAQLYWYIIRQNMDKDPVYKDYTLDIYQFAVISNNNRIPLIWEYSDTKSEVDCFYGKNKEFECKNWRNIVGELDYYLTEKPTFPIGISEINSITKWLNK